MTDVDTTTPGAKRRSRPTGEAATGVIAPLSSAMPPMVDRVDRVRPAAAATRYGRAPGADRSGRAPADPRPGTARPHGGDAAAAANVHAAKATAVETDWDGSTAVPDEHGEAGAAVEADLHDEADRHDDADLHDEAAAAVEPEWDGEDGSAAAANVHGEDGSPGHGGEASDARTDRVAAEHRLDGHRRAWQRALRRPRVWAAGVVAAAVIAVMAWGGVTLAANASLQQARTSALAAGRSDAQALITYQYQHLTADWAVVHAHATASFWRAFSQSSAGLRRTLTQYQASSSGSVLAVGLASATTSRAVVLAFVDQRVTSTASKTPTVDESRVEITLVRPAGRWLIQRVELIG